MLKAFTDELHLNVARLVKQDNDFRAFTEFLTGAVTDLALQATRVSGDKGEQLKGASLVMAELRDMIIQAPDVVRSYTERQEMSHLDDRDYMSP